MKITWLLILTRVTWALHFSLNIPAESKQCFYQVLEAQQKYAVEVAPRNGSYIDHAFVIVARHIVDGEWSVTWHRSYKQNRSIIKIHKLASLSSTYEFCIQNLISQAITLNLTISSGVAILDLEVLPSMSDEAILEKELKWVKVSCKAILVSAQRAEILRTSSIELGNQLSLRTVLFAIGGLLGIVLVNLLGYKQMLREFRLRKIM